MEYLHDESNAVIHKNARIGIGVTGICQSLDKLDWLDPTYRALKQYDAVWSEKNALPVSIKLTTVKPSGTLSLLAGVTPGIHPAYARYYIRRVRMSSDDILIDYCRNAGYTIEYAKGFDGEIDYTTSIVSFPCSVSNDTIIAAEMSAVKQLELIKRLQSIWSDNAVSATVYYKLEELDAIKNWLKENYETSIKAVSFLLHNDHGFSQAPYEEISVNEYNRMKSRVKPIVIHAVSSDIDDTDCATGACPIR